MKQGSRLLLPGGRRRNGFRALLPLLDKRGIEPKTLVFLTDLCGAFPSEAPVYPVLWPPPNRAACHSGR